MREVKTCDRCRHFKRRCDLVKPSCTRCVQAGVRCSFDVAGTTAPGSDGSTAPSSVLTNNTVGYARVPTSGSINSSASPSNPTMQTPGSMLVTRDTSASSPAGGPSPASSVSQNHGGVAVNGLISPTTTVESPEPNQIITTDSTPAQNSTEDTASNQEGQRIVRKRKRNCLSCLRCHRLKVKCDKELPCGRCKSSGNGRECYYSYNKGPNGGKFPCPTAPAGGPIDPDSKKPQLAPWQITHKVRGSSHWRELMARIGSLTPISQSPLAKILEGVATNACLANFSLPGNFPFGTPGATKYYARDTITRLISGEKDNVEEYLGRYVDMLDVVNPVLDLSTFQEEVHRYWQDPNAVGLCWLAQFLMVLGLGCFTSGTDPPIAIEFMMAAEACIMQTPFMFRPTISTIRAFTLMVVAKQICNATCWAMDSSYTLMGHLVRLAFILGLPQERNDNDEELRDPVEKEIRRKLWLTILYLDIKVSMCTGMPPLTRPEELGGLKNMPHWRAPDSLQMVLYQGLPVVLNILAQMNSKRDPISYPDVLRYNAQLRELMGHANRVCQAPLQRITIDIFLRRCLMVMHRPFALHADGPTMFPESYWSSLECSLALLFHYRELWDPETPQPLDLVGRPFVLDIFSATLTTCVHMLRQDAPLSEAAATGCLIPPRQLILETLVSCVDIWAGEQEKSVCWRTGYHILKALMVILDAPGAKAESPEAGQTQ
ncbi:N-terminal binuclear Zn cluster-containing protein [Metarhizium robertsii ARSEF 23]|nr:N-terminal binuclear Zn cluster-containing protein [Metarhizium robertsii ARSEF 23]EFY94790.2 N-terminal binuclear Zn cluster-containing protein [Metarhizium robertsii ARSEF 23]